MFQQAFDKFNIISYFQDKLPPGRHVINVSFKALEGDALMENPNAHTLYVDPRYTDYPPVHIATFIGHELIHVSHQQ